VDCDVQMAREAEREGHKDLKVATLARAGADAEDEE
jgi:hypothetical protein